MNFVIDNAIPPPSGRKNVYPFSSMSPGDSFWVEGDTAYKRARISAYSYAHRHGLTFKCQAGQAGGRIWRVE